MMRDAFAAAGHRRLQALRVRARRRPARRHADEARLLARVRARPGARRMPLCTCQHHLPENFWDPASQAHANGGEMCRAWRWWRQHPTDHHDFPASLHRRERSACEFDRRQGVHRERRRRDHRRRPRFAISSAFRPTWHGEGMHASTACALWSRDRRRGRGAACASNGDRIATPCRPLRGTDRIPPYGATLIFEAAIER